MVDQVYITANESLSSQLFFTKYLEVKHKFRRKALLEQLYCQNQMSAREVASALGCAHSSINRALKKYGMPLGESPRRPRFGKSSPNKSESQLKDEEKKIRQIKALLAKGHSLRQVASMFNERHYRTPSGRGEWTVKTLKRITNY